ADKPPHGNGDGLVTADELYDYVYDHVKAFVWDNYRRHQWPRKLGDIEGRIILASLRQEGPDKALDPAHLAEQYQKFGAERVDLPPKFITDAQKWLAAAPNFAPVRHVCLPLSLVEHGKINVQQFQALARDDVARLDSHLEASNAVGQRRLRAL